MRLGLFGDADIEAIRAEVDAAEARTAGEIVTYVVAACDEYPEARWRGAALGALLAVVVAAAVQWLSASWGSSMLVWAVIPALLGFGAGMAAAEWLPLLRRGLIGREEIERRTALRAEAAFLEEAVFATRERTGILLFLALFEHRAIVLGDEGINARVEPQEWQGIVDALTAGIRGGRAREALIEAIDACGRLLERREVAIRPDDRDELPDEPRFRER